MAALARNTVAHSETIRILKIEDACTRRIRPAGSDRSLREELLVGSLAGLHAANWRRIDQLPSPSIELIVRQCLAMNSVRMMMPTVMLAI